jgi:hypothetical protein
VAPAKKFRPDQIIAHSIFSPPGTREGSRFFVWREPVRSTGGAWLKKFAEIFSGFPSDGCAIQPDQFQFSDPQTGNHGFSFYRVSSP